MIDEFIVALLSANKEEQRQFAARKLSKGIFKERVAEVRWIWDYHAANTVYPTLNQFGKRFPAFPLSDIQPEPLTSRLDPLLDDHQMARVTSVVEQLQKDYDSGASISSVIASFRNAVAELETFSGSFKDLDVSDDSLAHREFLRRAALAASVGTGKGLFRFPTPWPTINDAIQTSEPGEFYALASRTSIGKSWVFLRLAEHFRAHGETVLFITMEMSKEQLNNRYTAMHYALDYPNYKRGSLPAKEIARWNRLRIAERALPKVGKLILSGNDSGSAPGFAGIIEKLDTYNPTVLMVDGAYLLYPEDLRKSANDVERLRIVSNTMKRMALQRSLRIWNSLQCGRDNETKEGDTTARLKDIYGSDAFAQDADCIFLLSGMRGSNRRQLEIGKGRDSAVGGVTLEFSVSPPRFEQVGGSGQLTTGSSGSVGFKTI